MFPGMDVPSPRCPPPSIDAEARRAVALGAALAVAIWLVPLTRFVLGYMGILVHELGHTATAWLFGYPAFPAFDFQYGGGLTSRHERQLPLVLAIVALFCWGLWKTRERRRLCGAVGILFAAWAILATTWMHEALMKAMGHGAELLFVGIFLYRALTGSGVRVPAERPLYAMVGIFIWIECVGFAWKLIHDAGARAAYENAKGGGHWMDFSILAEQYLRVELSSVARLFLFAALVTPPLVWWICRGRERRAPRLMSGVYSQM